MKEIYRSLHYRPVGARRAAYNFRCRTLRPTRIKFAMKRLWLLFSQTTTVVLAAYFVVLTLKPAWLAPRGSGPVALLQAPAGPADAVPVGSFRAAAHSAAMSVVSINTSQGRRRAPELAAPWNRFFHGTPDPDGEEPSSGIGSGVIVSDSGYILTNNHVVEGAEQIEVILSDQRRTRAKIIGTDPDSDLAVLKITLDKLPVMVLGDSNKAQVGDQVLAIGNPFGVGQTVTSGIVSALGRNQRINTFENFIQTDAAINPGNSGGALVDSQGHLLGINTAIYSRSGGNLGIGFAIPVATAKQVLESIVRDGQVTRGWIGVEPNDLSPEIAEAFGIVADHGVVISGVMQGGPAAQAGIVPGDVVLSIGDTAVEDVAHLLSAVAALKPGAVAKVSIQRKKAVLQLTLTPGVRPRPGKLPR